MVEIYSLSRFVTRSSGQEEPANFPLGRVGYDLIQLTEAYNGDNWVSHFRCFYTSMDFVFTHTLNNDALGVIKEFLKMTKTRYDQTVRFFRTDDERTLGLEFAEIMKMRCITTERSARYTPAQNGQTERSGGVLVIRARALRIAANLPASMWPEIFKTVGYLNNRTPMKMLGWKTPIDKLTGEKPKLSHLQPYGCRAFPLNQVVPRKEKLEPRAFIGYLVGYDSTNNFRIWIPSRMKVIRTRDVMFDTVDCKRLVATLNLGPHITRKWQNAGKNPKNYPHRLHANEVVLLVSIEATCRLVYVDAITRLFSLSPLPFSQNAPPSQ